MTFSVNGIKQEKNERYKVEMLVCVDAPLLARKILEEENVLILSLKEYSEDKETFGDIYFTINLNFQEITMVTTYTDIQEACDFFTFVGFSITNINSYSKPLTKTEVLAIIEKAQRDAELKRIQVQEQLDKKEAQERKVYQDAHLEAAKKIIVRVFEKVEETTKRSAGTVAILDTKRIHDLTEELRKLRMGTNFEKIRDTIQELFAIMETIDNEWYASIQNPSTTILPGSIVTPVDVDRELDRMETTKILKSLNAKIAGKNQDYVLFGSSAIFWKFLQKDLSLKISNVS
jgi:hypothetical protein